MDDNIIEYLVSFGFTTYEAKVYSTLVTMGRTIAGKLAINSQVPRARIYDVLSSLERKGWIETIKTTPIQYVSIPFEDAKEKLDVLEQNFIETKQTVLDELKANEAKTKEFDDEDQVIFVKTEDTIIKIKNIMEFTNKTLFFFRISSETAMMFLSELKRLKKKNVNIKLILKDKPEQSIMYKLEAVADVKIEECDVVQGSLYSDNNIVMNIYEQKNELYGTIISYKKCLYCLNAWLTREWDETK